MVPMTSRWLSSSVAMSISMSLRPGIVFGEVLGEVAAGRGELALRAAELLEHQVGEARVGLADADGVLQALVVSEHGCFPW